MGKAEQQRVEAVLLDALTRCTSLVPLESWTPERLAAYLAAALGLDTEVQHQHHPEAISDLETTISPF